MSHKLSTSAEGTENMTLHNSERNASCLYGIQFTRVVAKMDVINRQEYFIITTGQTLHGIFQVNKKKEKRQYSTMFNQILSRQTHSKI